VCVCVCVRERERERFKTVLIPVFDILKYVFLRNTLRCVNTLLRLNLKFESPCIVIQFK